MGSADAIPCCSTQEAPLYEHQKIYPDHVRPFRILWVGKRGEQCMRADREPVSLFRFIESLFSITLRTYAPYGFTFSQEFLDVADMGHNRILRNQYAGHAVPGASVRPRPPWKPSTGAREQSGRAPVVVRHQHAPHTVNA